MKYTVYRTTNLVNGKFYIGVHKTKNPNDSYLGSGSAFRKAVDKYGSENFKKEVLFIFDNEQDMLSKEKELVTEEVVKDQNCYNQIGGGNCYPPPDRVFDPEIRLQNLKKGRETQALLKLTGSYADNINEKRSNTLKRFFSDRDSNFKGWQHSDRSKSAIGKKSSVHQSGRGNSQYGTCWITKDGINRKTKVEDLQSFLDMGWVKGRKL